MTIDDKGELLGKIILGAVLYWIFSDFEINQLLTAILIAIIFG